MASRTLALGRWTALVVLGSAAGIACRGGPIDGPTADVATVRVTLARAGSGAAAQVAAWYASTAGIQGQIDLASVDAICVTLDRIEFLPDGEDAAWLSLDVDEPGDGNLDCEELETSEESPPDNRINLLALPVGGDGIELATGDLDPGAYANVRLFVSNPMLWLNTALQVGPFTYETGGHDVTIPSGSQTGIKTDQGFTIPDDGSDVLLVFDENATLANVHATGNGRVMMAPVLRVAGNDE